MFSVYLSVHKVEGVGVPKSLVPGLLGEPQSLVPISFFGGGGTPGPVTDPVQSPVPCPARRYSNQDNGYPPHPPVSGSRSFLGGTPVSGPGFFLGCP